MANMESVNDYANRILTQLAAEREAQIKSWTKNKSVPELLEQLEARPVEKLLPEALSVNDFARATCQNELSDVMERLRDCSVCADGLAVCCKEEPVSVERGHLHVWNDGFKLQLCQRYVEFQLRRRLERFGYPVRLTGSTFDNFVVNDPARTRCREYCERFGDPEMRGKGLLLQGSIGIGKTHLAVAVTRELLNTSRIRSARYWYAPEFLHRLRDSYEWPREEREALFNRTVDADLLVLDDLGAERTTEWAREQFNIIINSRWANGRAVIVTTNDDLSRYEETLGERTYSRLRALVPFAITVSGKDQRRG